jgi:nucleoside-diphosphate-sugar epimerase
MAKHAFIVGGTGQIGRALALRFRTAGWDVTVSHRGQRGISAALSESGTNFVMLDRGQPGALLSALKQGADAIIDTVAYDETHAAQLLAIQGNVGAIAVMSSISVYCDDQGRTLDEASADSIPMMPVPIPETHPTTPPGPATYSTRRVALEQKLLGSATVPVTILRPGAIYGPGALHPREWWFVKRILDGRRQIPLAFEGQSRFTSTSVANLAAMTLMAIEKPGTRILNAVDPNTPTVYERGVAIAAHMGAECEFIRLPTEPGGSGVGFTPWSVRAPFVADDSAARLLGYAPAETYAQGVVPMIGWLVETQARGDWREHFPEIVRYDPFDYAAEDDVLLKRSATTLAVAKGENNFGSKLVARKGSFPADIELDV